MRLSRTGIAFEIVPDRGKHLLDNHFVQNVARSSDDRFFVRTLLDLARHLGAEVVAEWVTDETSARLLADWGVDYLQGELFDEAGLGERAQALATGTGA